MMVHRMRLGMFMGCYIGCYVGCVIRGVIRVGKVFIFLVLLYSFIYSFIAL